MPEVRYQAECGCNLKKNQLEQGGNKAKTGSCYYCGEHGKPVINRQIYCEPCKKWVDENGLGTIPTFCKYHRELKAFWTAKRNHRIRLKPNFKENSRGDYCISKAACMAQGGYDCESCRVMLPIMPNVDPHRMIGAA